MLTQAKTDKPLCDWTLGEVHSYCSNTSCGSCLMWQNDHCRLDRSPSHWSLDPDVIELTSEERIKLALLSRLFDGVWKQIKRDENGNLSLYDYARHRFPIMKTEFPSIKSGTAHEINKLLGR